MTENVTVNGVPLPEYLQEQFKKKIAVEAKSVIGEQNSFLRKSFYKCPKIGGINQKIKSGKVKIYTRDGIKKLTGGNIMHWAKSIIDGIRKSDSVISGTDLAKTINENKGTVYSKIYRLTEKMPDLFVTRRMGNAIGYEIAPEYRGFTTDDIITLGFGEETKSKVRNRNLHEAIKMP